MRALCISVLSCVCALTLDAQATVPFCAGLTVVSAVNDPRGDYEPILTVASIGKDRVILKYSAQGDRKGVIQHVDVTRTVMARDMANARLLMNWWAQNAPASFPGTTSLQASVAMLRDLKTKGEADIGLVDRAHSDVPSNRSHPNLFDFEQVFRLHRTSQSDLPVQIIVNDRQVALPAVRAAGENMGDKAEFLFLDDPLHPIALAFRYTPLGQPSMTSRAVKIMYHCAPQSSAKSKATMSALEKALLETRKADVYQIYFDFNSDHVRPESAPTLNEIAEILKRHPDWKLAINGHTDNIGGDAYNLKLSQQRAASVRKELVAHYGIQAARITTGGAGASQPKATNATLEGRAQNRRVEIIRQ